MLSNGDSDLIDNGGGGDGHNDNSNNSSDASSSSDSGSENESIKAIKNNYRHPPLAAKAGIIDYPDSSSGSSSDDGSSSSDGEALAVVPKKILVVVKKSNRMEAQLGLIFPVARIKRHLREITGSSRISNGSGISMAAAMESLEEFILEQSELALPIGPKTKERKRSKMMPRDLQMARQDNLTMVDVLRGTVIAHGGVLPNMPVSLLGPKRNRKRKRRAKRENGVVVNKPRKRQQQQSKRKNK